MQVKILCLDGTPKQAQVEASHIGQMENGLFGPTMEGGDLGQKTKLERLGQI